MASRAERTYVARSGTSATNTTAVALAAATAKSVLVVMGTASTSLGLKRVRVSFNSVTATEAPAIVEVGIVSAAGTVTSFTPVQVAGRAVTGLATAGYNATVEPTFVRILDAMYVPVQNGLFEYWYPLGEEIQADASQGFAIRITSPAAASCLPSILFAE